jgi:hypothetical protein
VIWKEPLVVRQQRVTQSREFEPKRLLKLSLLSLFSGLPLTACLFALHPLNWPGWQVYVRWSLYFSGLALLSLFVTYGVVRMVNKFEVTYSVDSTGIRIHRAGGGHVLLWRFIRSLEIVSHPTIENIALLRCEYRVIGKSNIEEIPFELGQIDTSAIVEFHKKHGPNE